MFLGVYLSLLGSTVCWPIIDCSSESLCVFFFFFFWLCCGILVCHPGIEPRPMAVKTRPPGNSSLQSLLITFYFCDISCNVFY